MENLSLIVDLDYIYIEKLGEWVVHRLNNSNQAEDIVKLTECLYYLTDNIFYDIIDGENTINCSVIFDNNTVTLNFIGIIPEVLKHKKNEFLTVKKKVDTIAFNEKDQILTVSKYFFVEDEEFDKELSGLVRDISDYSAQSSENIDDSFMGLSSAEAENIISRLKNYDKRNFYCFERFFYDYSSKEILDNLFYFRRVSAGQLLAATLLPVIKSKVFKAVIPGENVLMSKDRKTYYSKISGRIRWQGELLEVSAVKSIDKPVKNYDKEIKCDNASLIINGGLNNCGSVIVDKDLYVIGNIINTNIIAGGSIYVSGKIENCVLPKIVEAKENIIAGYIRNSKVTAGLNVIVSEDITDSEICAGADVLLDGGSRLICGGSIEAGKSVVCSCIGDGEKETRITLAADTPEISERKKLSGMRDEFQKALKALIFRFNELTELRDKGQATQKDTFEIRDLSQKKIKYEKNIDLINKKIEELNVSRSNAQINLRLSVKDTIHPKTLIKINNIPKEINEPLNEVSLFFHKNTIASGKYTSTRPADTVTPPENSINKSREQIDANSIRKVIAVVGSDKQSCIETAVKFLGIPEEKFAVEQIAVYDKTVKNIIIERKDTDADDAFIKQYVPLKIENIVKSSVSVRKIKIEADTIDECLNRISKEHKMEKSKIKYKVLQEGKSGFLGMGGRKYIVEAEI